MNNIKKVLSAWMLVACVLPVAAQYPVIPDSVKARGAKQEAEFERKSDAAWEKALPTVLEEAKKGRPYKPWASKPEDLIKSNIPAFPGAEGGGMYTPGGRGGKVIVVTSLEDSGPGIDENYRDSIFERFAKVDAFTQGTGLGLSIVRQIMELVDGNVYLDTSYAGGARFVVEWPQ